MKAKKTNSKDNKLISASGIMSKYRISYQTINHYTNFGLLSVALKKGNVRFYNPKLTKRRLNKIRELMRQGYSLQLIRKRLIGI